LRALLSPDLKDNLVNVFSLFRCTDGIIFVVDSSDVDRIEEARLELLKIAKLTERCAVPILVLANKQVNTICIQSTLLLLLVIIRSY